MIPLASFRLLLYPLGLLASCLFGTRILYQWIKSEKKKQSFVSQGFWRLSLIAHILMVIHTFIQSQVPLCIIQCLNGIIAWRNLDLMHSSKRTWRFTAMLMVTSSFLLTFLFVLQGAFVSLDQWMRAPLDSLYTTPSLPLFWHLIGVLGMVLFSFRFWLQWWSAEQKRSSHLGKGFWWMSLIGAAICVCYFISLKDFVNLIGYATGIIPYLRNLILIKKTPRTLPYSSSIFIFAGEQSGDVLGGTLVKNLKEKAPHYALWGVGGKEMQNAGLHSFLPIESFQVMGFTAVFKALPRLFFAFRKLKRAILEENPLAVVCIDYPDFTMRLEKSLRNAGYQGKLVHYVSPTVWAWRKNRIKTLAKTLDLLFVLFPFEKKCFSHTSLSVMEVEHPLLQTIQNYQFPTQWRSSYNFEEKRPILAIFPGSRTHEIESNLPIQLQVATQFLSKHPHFQCAISVARPSLLPLIQKITKQSSLNPRLVEAEARYPLMKETSLALATSGTITLELALSHTPTVVTYQIGSLNYLLGRYLFRINLPYFCLANLLAEKEIFPEFFARSLTVEPIHEALLKLYSNQQNCREACATISRLLSQEDAQEKVPAAILNLIHP